MVVGLGADRDRVVSGGGGFVVAQSGAGGGVVEDLDDLGAEAAGELAAAAGRVLPRDPALLVRGGAERQVGLAEQPVVGDHAVAGRVDARQPRPHAPVHSDRAAGAEAGPGADGEGGFRADPGHHQDKPGVHGDRRAAGRDRLDAQRGGLAGPGAADLPYRGAGEHGHAAGFQLGADQGAELAVDGGQHLGELLELGDPPVPRAVSASAISRPM